MKWWNEAEKKGEEGERERERGREREYRWNGFDSCYLFFFFFLKYIYIFFSPFLTLSPVTDKIPRYFFVRALNRIELCATRQSMFHTHASELFLYFYWFSFCRAYTHNCEAFPLYIYMLCLMDFEKCIEHVESSEFHMRFSLFCSRYSRFLV